MDRINRVKLPNSGLKDYLAAGSDSGDDDFFPSQRKLTRFPAGAKFTVREIAISDIDDFPEHPYPVISDAALEELKGSISTHGQLEPALVRQMPDGRFQLLSGHRRKLALTELGIEKINAQILTDISDDMAEAIMLDCNVRRPDLLPSEKARIYADRKAVMKKLGKANLQKLRDMFTAGGGTDGQAKYTLDFLELESGESASYIKSYIRFNSMEDSLKKMVDEGILPFFTAANELYSFSPNDQDLIADYIKATSVVPTKQQCNQLRSMCENSSLTAEMIKDFLSPKRRGAGKQKDRQGSGTTEITKDTILKVGKKVASMYPEGVSATEYEKRTLTYVKSYIAITDILPENTSPEKVSAFVMSLVREWQKEQKNKE